MKFLIDQNKISSTGTLDAYFEFLRSRLTALGYVEPSDFIKLPGDDDSLAAILDLARAKNPGGVKWVILVGIGGSSLGVEAVYQALNLTGAKEVKSRFAKLTVADTVDASAISSVVEELNHTTLSAAEMLMIVVSKSGQTIETTANAAIIYQALLAKFGAETARDRVVVVSDAGSPMMDLALREGFSTLTIPNPVGGRFSIFSGAGLLPLAVCGIDIKELAAGGALVSGLFFKEIGQSARFLFEQYQQGKNICDFFVFDKDLEGVGKWYRQLLAESAGKDGKGLTPVVLVGSTDLHSQAQLVFGGHKNRVTTLLSVESSGNNDQVVPPSSGFVSLSPGLGGKSLGEIMRAIYRGVVEAYREVDLPTMEISLADMSAKEIGTLMQFLLIQTVCLCQELGVDPYGQPAVENYKSKTREILLK